MARVVMYLEVPDKGKDEGGSTAYDRLCDALQGLVESDELDGYFTLTFNEQPWYPDRPDLSKLSVAVATGQRRYSPPHPGFPEGGA